MPEPILINHSKLTEQGIKEAMAGYMRSSFWIVLRLVLLSIAGAGVFLIVRGIQSDAEPLLIMPGAFILIMSLFLYIHRLLLFPSSYARRAISRKQEQYGTKEIRMDYYFYDDHVVSRVLDGADATGIDYADIRRVFRTVNYIAAVTGQRQIMVLDPGGFEPGDADSFFELMKEKSV